MSNNVENNYPEPYNNGNKESHFDRFFRYINDGQKLAPNSYAVPVNFSGAGIFAPPLSYEANKPYQNPFTKFSPISLVVRGILFTILFFALTVGGDILGALLSSIFASPESLEANTMDYGQFVNYSVLSGALMIAIFILVLNRIKLYDFGYSHQNQLKLKAFGLWVITGYLVGMVVLQITSLPLPDTNTENQQVLEEIAKKANGLSFFAFVALTGPILEELFYRKFLIGILGQCSVFSVLFSAVLFGYGHVHSQMIEILPYLGLGLVLGYIYYQTRDIKLTIAIHILNNSIAALFMIL